MSLTYSGGVGFLKYNSLQVKVQHQMKSLFILNSFTWSKAFDLAAANGESANGDSEFVNFANIPGDAGVSGYNQPLNDSLALTWDMPFGRNNRALHGTVKQAISGWTLTAINRMTSGLLINLTYDPATTALTTDLGYSYRPNITGNVSSLIIPKKSWTRSASATSNVFNVSQISVPAANAPYGNSGRNSLIGPGYYNLDAGIHKTFSLMEKLNLTFRAETFNVFNNTNFKSPGTDYSVAGFGQYTNRKAERLS
ncbi:MAG: TonB-dependent receptor [Edaphobacter sp.]|nr:TonB-dependent receptor [Edaphobacter sp.]